MPNRRFDSSEGARRDQGQSNQKERATLFIEVIDSIRNAEVAWTVQDLKSCIFADNLRDCELIEAIVAGVYHNFSLFKDALNRTGNTVEDLIAAAFTLMVKYPDSYFGEDSEWAIWDVADGYVMDALASDSRICKRAGW